MRFVSDVIVLLGKPTSTWLLCYVIGNSQNFHLISQWQEISFYRPKTLRQFWIATGRRLCFCIHRALMWESGSNEVEQRSHSGPSASLAALRPNPREVLLKFCLKVEAGRNGWDWSHWDQAKDLSYCLTQLQLCPSQPSDQAGTCCPTSNGPSSSDSNWSEMVHKGLWREARKGSGSRGQGACTCRVHIPDLTGKLFCIKSSRTKGKKPGLSITLSSH